MSETMPRFTSRFLPAPRERQVSSRLDSVAMKARPFEELKWDVPTPDLLRELSTEQPPASTAILGDPRSFYRDLYFDTADGSLSRRGIVCRWRVGADDRRTPQRLLSRITTRRIRVPETDPVGRVRRRQRGRQTIARWSGPCRVAGAHRLEVERLTRDARSPWPWGGRFALMYDAVSVRRSGIVRGFQELKLRRVDPGVPSLERIGEAIGRLRASGHDRDEARASTAADRESRAGGARTRHRFRRATVLLAIDGGKVALRQTSRGLRLPAGEGQGESACRHLLQEALGSGVGDLSFLGTVPGVGTIHLLDDLGRPTDPPGPGHAE